MAGRRNTLLSIIERLQPAENGCLVWTGPLNRQGYGKVRYEGRQYQVHRLIYEQTVGPVPEGLQIDHLCRNPSCANPKHLEPVTCRENLLRGNTLAARNAKKESCSRGHPYVGDNLRINKCGERICRACEVIKRRRRQAARQAGGI